MADKAHNIECMQMGDKLDFKIKINAQFKTTFLGDIKVI